MASNIEEKYSQERSKRLRPDGNNQYMTVRSPDTQSLAEDPWVDYESLASQEQPLKDGGSIKFLIIGAGHNGILFAARLIDAGFNPKDIVLVDIAGGYGGNWYWNRYPGLMCDVEGYCYLPLLEETGYMPEHKYSFGAEIRGQSERSAAHYGLQAMFCTKVNKQVWDETRGRWVVNMTQSFGHVREPTNLTVDAQFVLLASGVLTIPKVPKAPGFADFRSRHEVFHTSRWDYNITGGSQQQPDLVNLRNKRVAIIGTGATAVQAIPHLAQWAKHLYVIQRTPSYCGERAQKETTHEDWAKIADGPGWQERRRNNLNSYLSADPEPVDLVNDGWSKNQARAGLIGSNSKLLAPGPGAEHIRKLLEIDTPIAEELRARVDRIVRDTSTAEKLKPWYAGWCKRPTFNDDYLQTFNRDNVTLIDTDGKGIDGYTARGIMVAGQEIDVDVLVMATGFILSSSLPPSSQSDAPIIGSGGRNIDDKWGSPDFGTLFGVASHGFPNFFANFKKGAGSSYNITSAYEEMARLVAYIVREADKQSRNPSSVVINVLKEAEDKWGDEVAKRAGWFSALAACTPSYFNNEGQASMGQGLSPEEAALQARKAGWGSGILDYKRVVDDYCQDTNGKLAGFNINEVSA